MTKIIVTESQLKKLTQKINEDFMGRDDIYRVGRCNVNLFGIHELTYKGREVEDVNASEIDFTFQIDLSFKSYGIKDLSPYNPQGPSELEIEVLYYDENEEEIEETTTVQLDWENVMQDDADISWIGYDNQIDIRLKNNENGDIIVETMTIFKKSL
jgi:hypothetical protein